eukprot:768358-Hanusia_phi.AAC.3
MDHPGIRCQAGTFSKSLKGRKDSQPAFFLAHRARHVSHPSFEPLVRHLESDKDVVQTAPEYPSQEMELSAGKLSSWFELAGQYPGPGAFTAVLHQSASSLPEQIATNHLLQLWIIPTDCTIGISCSETHVAEGAPVSETQSASVLL